MNLGEKVRFIRKSNDLNQKEFALRVGVSQGTLSDIERGVCLPSCETISALRIKFNCDLNWLLDEEGTDSSSTQTTITNEELKLLDSIRSLPPREKEELLEIIHIKLRKNKYPNTD
ncbi:transcriptional regulator with XRE-family HTH domain [Paenibacillus phyllosphaerae]|uniref:Transcriptional regulator with XRE-family HTH domain n=1 Tax=Paenibacillus phyllosphaerae TaxID=274593 RepID=A0A7W5FNX9_9BACL|nr:helix-turn-helix transcriptional regulator [Paenibacillus phyllosphaerae]MBB3111775.1 transcriptional regulator with XRE-family HTH domain [Paenibacillus phyllosphaerae]